MLNTRNINILGNLVNTTWGSSSITGRKPGTKMYKLPQHSIKVDIIDDKTLRIKYTDIITYAFVGAELKQLLSLQNDKSAQVINKVVGNLKSKYKKESKEPLRLKERRTEDSFEMMSRSYNGPRNTGAYRKIIYFDLV